MSASSRPLGDRGATPEPSPTLALPSESDGVESSPALVSSRPSGIAALGALRWGTHLCHFYRTREELVELLVPFVQAGLQANERCVWVTATPLSVEEARTALARSVPNLTELERAGQVEIVDEDACRSASGADSDEAQLESWLEREHRALVDGYDGLRACGHTCWIVPGRSHDERVALERRSLRERRLLVLCSYGIEHSGPSELMDALRTHDYALIREPQGWIRVQSAPAFEPPGGTADTESLDSRSSHVSLVDAPSEERGHDVRFYDAGRFPAERIAAYLAPALKRDGTALVVATKDHVDAIRRALDALGARPAEAEARRRLVIFDAETMLAALEENGALNRERFDALVGSLFGGVLRLSTEMRAFGEGVDLLCSQGRHDEAVLLEQWWSELRAELGFSVLCAYQLDNFSDSKSCAPFSRVCAAHDTVHATDLNTTAAGFDSARLLAHLEQRTRVLDGVLKKEPELGADRSRASAPGARGPGGEATAGQHLARLQRVSTALALAATLDDVRRVAETVIVEALGASSAALAIASEGRELEHLASESTRADDPEREALVRGLEWVHRAGTALWPRALPGVIAVPLTLGAGYAGAAAFAFAHEHPLVPADRGLIEDFARQLGLALDRALAHELLHRECLRAEEANRAKDDFLAMLGHELRNPLAPMLTALELMRMRANDVAERERLVLERQVQHMIRLVDDLLDVSRITRGKVELSPKRVELSAIVREALEHASPMLETRRHRLLVDVPHGLVILADPRRLAQVVTNLLTNAAKYTPEQGSIEVRATRGDGTVRLAVKDDGVGIQPSLLPRLFDLFVQGPQSLDRSRGGLGLGLTLVRRLVEMHGGTASAESEGPGQGSTFTIELPLLETGHDALREAKSRPSASPGPTDAVSILLVDDNVDAADMLAEVLRARGHRVAVAYDGPSALSLLDEFDPDLALLDIGLPVMDGFELAEKIRTRHPTSPLFLVALSGYGQPTDRARGTAAGFDLHLVKPVDLKELDTLVDRVRQRREQMA